MSRFSSIILFVSISFQYSLGDVSHYFAPELSYFQHHHHIPQQQAIPIAFQPGFPAGLYGPPAQGPPQVGYPNPVGPSQVVTPAPVAPVAPSTTEFTLPEIVDNRSAKDHRNFIPLNKDYLPPLEERPNYESPQQGNHDKYPFNGYIYQKPSTSTTTERPRPIVVEEFPPEFLPPINNETPNIPPLNNDEIVKPPFSAPSPAGYDYNVPPLIVNPEAPYQRPSTPAPVYLPAASEQQQQTVIENTDPSISPLRLRVHEMRCLQNSERGGYFRSVLKVDSFIGATPTVDNDSNDKRCELKLHKSYVVIDIAGEDFNQCGVQKCGQDLCLRLRFPALRGMRTGSDSILTLHCKSQNRVAVKTHALKMGVANDVQSRSVGTYAKGGTQNSLRTHVELLRKTPQGYARHLQSNDAVQLGEDLLLRAHVLMGDGWNYTKLTDVSLQRISPSGEVLNNVNLITPRGCLNPSMRGICTQPPSYDAPLGYKLPFKAVMFQGMRSGDELIMSMRITGCLDYNDCQVSTDQCAAVGNLVRRKRDMLETSNSTGQNHNEISEISKISFRVILPEGKNATTYEENFMNSHLIQSKSLILMGSFGFVGLLVVLGIIVALKLRK